MNEPTKPSDNDLAARLDLAVRAAREAGRHTLKYFQRSDLHVERKADQSPVTIADREAEQLLRERIAEQFPDDAIIGEEFGEQPGTSGYQWILDPIDGTKSFICGVPLYGTLVGVVRSESNDGGESLAGVIYIPGLDECVYAAKGSGAWCIRGDSAPQAARVSATTDLNDAIFLTSQVDTFWSRGAGDAYRRLEKAARITRTWGDCYGYLLVATGRADLMVDPAMHVWDAAALLPIFQEAGGAFTDWQGEPTIHSGEGIAANPKLLPAALAITRDYPRCE